MSPSITSEIDSLLDVSARIGGNPLLVQAATGNTSLKLDGVLWIKASGKWLARAAQDDILIPVDLARTRERIARNSDPAGDSVVVNGERLGTSVETAMHAVLPARVVLHVHSVSVIALAVRRDGRAELAARLAGLDWQWIPYLPSGLPLAREIAAVVERFPATRVLVLANHGLVVCGETCAEAEELLREIERRVAIEPRRAAEPNWAVLAGLTEHTHWQMPASVELHSMGTDEIARRIVCGGILYPCQSIFLTARALCFPQTVSPGVLAGIDEPFVLIEGAGVLVRANASSTQSATLAGLAQVLRRIPDSAPVEYLREDQVQQLLCADVYHYREMVEHNGGMLSSPSRG
ncbi:MAG: class II aldolase/adducin family protein [Acidobacteriota bacterium]|nr:class II aldolase/adducin family protein [Acidobacteriota bacterium]